MPLLDHFEPLIVLIRPLMLLGLSLYFLPTTLLHLMSTKPASLLSWSQIKDAWFARFWKYFGPRSLEMASPVVEPLLHRHATGKVLDIGSGQGHFLRLYPAHQITKIYAVEPNKDHHAQLLANAKAAGLVDSNKFEIVDARIENLSQVGIDRGSMDTICTLQTLCSIPHPQTLIPEIRTYLKKGGGKWIVYEHVRRPERNGFIALYQKALNLIWPEVLNGCNLTRRTREWIEETGGWQTDAITGAEKLRPLSTDSEYSVIPSVCGILVTQ